MWVSQPYEAGTRPITDEDVRLWGVTMAKAHAGGTALGSQPRSYAARKAQSQENMDKQKCRELEAKQQPGLIQWVLS